MILEQKMKNMIFDTLRYARTLMQGGIPQQHAEAQAAALAEVIDNELATKRDLKDLEISFSKDINNLEVSLKKDMNNLEISLRGDMNDLRTNIANLESRLENKLLIKLGGMMSIYTAIFAIFFHH
jgi:hypothetical protein